VPIGGHNLLEPAQWAKPVIFGPHIDHCRDMARLLLEEGGAIQIQNQDELLSQFLHLLDHPLEAEQMGQRAFAVVQRHRGVTTRNLQWIDQLLGVQESPSASSVTTRSSQVESKEFSTQGLHS
jgi:3-deoxy-D-manno-octulosonic-acid transferase